MKKIIVKMLALTVALAMTAALASCEAVKNVISSDQKMQAAGLTLTLPKEMFVYDPNDGISADAAASGFEPVYNSDVAYNLKNTTRILGKDYSLYVGRQGASQYTSRGKDIEDFISDVKSYTQSSKYNMKESNGFQYYDYTMPGYFGNRAVLITTYFTQLDRFYYYFMFYSYNSTSDALRPKYEKVVTAAVISEPTPESREVTLTYIDLSDTGKQVTATVDSTFTTRKEFEEMNFKTFDYNDSYGASDDYYLSNSYLCDAKGNDIDSFIKSSKNSSKWPFYIRPFNNYTKVSDDLALEICYSIMGTPYYSYAVIKDGYLFKVELWTKSADENAVRKKMEAFMESIRIS